jgi:hypothetical protein
MEPEFDEEGRNYWNHGAFNKLLSRDRVSASVFRLVQGSLAIVEGRAVTVASKSMQTELMNIH